MITKEKIKAEGKKTCNWIKEHKKEVLCCGVLAVLSYSLYKRGTTIKSIDIDDPNVKTLEDIAKIDSPSVKIDEDIFTRVAPLMEDAILDEGVEKFNFEDAYEIGQNVSKTVKISIDTVYGD